MFKPFLFRNIRQFLACNSRYLWVVYAQNPDGSVRITACNSRYLWAVYTNAHQSNIFFVPATAGICGWYIPRYTTCLYIICTKLKIFSAFLQTNTRQFPDGYFYHSNSYLSFPMALDGSIF